MTFGQSIATCFMKYADFSGRGSRPEFWWFVLFGALAGMILGAMSQVAGYVFQVALLLPTLAAGARRLHDTDKSGLWWLMALVPVAGIIVLIIFWASAPKEPNRFTTPAT